MLTSVILGGNTINCWKLVGHGQILQADVFRSKLVAGMDIRSELVAGTIRGIALQWTHLLCPKPWKRPHKKKKKPRNVEVIVHKPPNNTMIAATKIVWII